ncbi:MAG TPA: flagellar type III secretion system pore protein FliP [Acidobacteriota bacterium]|nr:flagellar type III secretion system pore protein FliP [Acidobacteriota bacterium]
MRPLLQADGNVIIKRLSRRSVIFFALVAAYLALWLPGAFAGGAPPPQEQQRIPDINITLGEGAEATTISLPLQILLLVTVLSLLPSILIMLTSFTRIVIVFHFMRQALGTQTVPPNQVLIGMALFLTMMIMWPVGQSIWNDAVVPYNEGNLGAFQAVQAAEGHIRNFMMKFIRERDLNLFMEISGVQASTFEEVPTYVVVPAFMLSEVKTAFEIGFLVFLPFLIIDMVVASVLLSMGMIMLPPILISMPFKLLVFVLVDGWYLVIGSLVRSFTMG